MENWHSRNSSFFAVAANAFRIAGASLNRRRLFTSRTSRTVTWSAVFFPTFARGRCGTPARSLFFRPAPSRAPPHVLGRSGSCFHLFPALSLLLATFLN